MSDQKELIPTKELIRLAQEKGISLGKGDPNNRLRYWTKIGLFPHAQRKLIPGSMATEGHYSPDALEILEKIETLHQQGLSSQEIKNRIMPDALVPTSKLIEIAKKRGIDLGKGDAYNRIRYWTKIGLLPHAQRKMVPGANATEGHYPISTLETLGKIEAFTKQGLKPEEIKARLEETKIRDKEPSQQVISVPVITPGVPVLKTEHLVQSSHSTKYKLLFASLSIFLLLMSGSILVFGLSSQTRETFTKVAQSYFDNFGKNFLSVFDRELAQKVYPESEQNIADINEYFALDKKGRLVLKKNLPSQIPSLISSQNVETITPSAATLPVNTLVLDQDGNIKIDGSISLNNLALSGTLSGGVINTAPGNMIKNSSFEANTPAASKKPRFWEYFSGSNENNTQVTQESVRTGNLGLKFNCQLSIVNCQLNLGVSQPITQTRWGTAYTLSAYFRTQNARFDKIRLSFWDNETKSRMSIKEFSLPFRSSDSVGAKEGDWFRLSVTIDNNLIPKGQNYYPVIEVVNLTTGTLYLDDIQLEEGTTSTLYYQESTEIADGAVITDPSGNIYPRLNSTGSLGLPNQKFSALYLNKGSVDINGNMLLSGGITADGGITSGGNLTIESTTQLRGNVQLGNQDTDSITYTGRVGSNIDPSANNTYDFGSSGLTWRSLYLGTDATIGGDAAVNGGDLTSTSTTFNLLNSTVTTLNIGGAATTVNIGASTGTTTINNNLALSGSLTPTGQIKASDGTASAPGYTFSSDTDTGLYRIGANKIGLITGGSATSGITIDGAGQVGIGTTAPGTTLDVVGTGRFSSTLTASNGFTQTTGALNLTSTSGSAALTLTSSTTAFNINSGLLDIDTSNSRIGIGTTAPTDKLDINGALKIGATYAGMSTTAPVNGLLVQGNIGIANTAPSTTLDVTGTGRFSSTLTASNGLTLTTGALTLTSTSGSAALTLTSSTTALNINAGLLDIDTSNSKVGIGTTAPASTLSINGGISAGTYSGVASPSNGLIISGNVGIATTNPTYQLDVNGTARLGATLFNGDITAQDNTIDIGTAGTRFGKGYFDEINATTLVGTMSGGNVTADTITINSDNTSDDAEPSNLAFERGSAVPNALITWNSTSKQLDTNSAFNILGTTALTTSPILGIATSTPHTTGDVLDLTATYTPTAGGTQSAIDINLTNSPSTNANILRGLDMSFTDSGNLANTVYGLFVDVTTANTTDTTYAAVFSGGKVGIGTTAPTDTLDINGALKIGSTYAGMSTTAPVNGLLVQGNVGIANTAPGTTLDVTGTGRFSSTLTASNGLTQTTGALNLTATSGSAALTLTSSTTAFNVNSGLLDIDTSNSRVGIGTTAPSSPLHVDPAATTTTASSFAKAFIDNTNAITTNVGNTTVYGLMIDEPNIIVGTTTPATSASLYISGAATEATTNYALQVNTGNSYFGGNVFEADEQFFRTGNDSDMMVGIKPTASEEVKMLMRDNSGFTPFVFGPGVGYDQNFDHALTTNPTFFVHSALNPAISNNEWGSFAHDQTGLIITTGANIGVGTTAATIDNYIAFAPRGTERVRFDGAGNVGIGTTNPSAMLSVGSTSQFQVSSTGAVTAVGLNSGSGLIQGTGGITVTGTANINATGTSATSIGNATAGALALASDSNSSFTVTTGDLTLSTATSGTLALTSAGALNLSAGAASTWTLPTSTTALNIASGLLDIDTSNSRVGIGTTAPGGTLDIAQSVTAASAGTYYSQKINNTYTGTMASATPVTSVYSLYSVPTIGIGGTSPQLTSLFVNYLGSSLGVSTTTVVTNLYNLYVASPTTSGGSSVTNKYALVTEASAGNIGLGTTTPTDRLDINGALKIGSTYAGMSTTAPVNGLLVQGNVGIGTTNPLGSLHIVNNSASPQVLVYGTDNNTNSSTSFWNGQLTQIRIENSSTTANTLAGIALRGPGGNSMSGIANIQETDQLGALGFYTGGQGRSSTVPERMRIDSAGNVGIGTTSPGGTLDVRGQYSFFGSTQGYTYISNNELDFMYGSNANDAGYINWNGYQGGTTQFRDTIIGTGKSTRMATFQGSTGNFVVGAVTNPGSVISSGGNLSVGGNYYSIAAPANGAIIEGNVGIGTTAPSSMLDIASTTPTFRLTDTTASAKSLLVDVDNNVAQLREIAGATGSLLALDLANARIGLGTTAPGGSLDIAQSVTATTGQTYYSQKINNTYTGTMSSATPVTSIYSSYNVPTIGIGGTSPQLSRLFVDYVGSSLGVSTTTVVTNLYNLYVAAPTTSGGSSVTNKYALVTEAGAGNIGLGTTAPTDRLDINGALKIGSTYAGMSTTAPVNGLLVQGNVGIGTTAPGYLLDVTSAATNQLNVIRVMNIGPNAGGVYAQHRSEVYSSSNDTDAGAFAALRTRGTKASPLAVISGDILGSFSVEGQASTTPGDSYTSGIIRAEVDGDVSGTNIPTRWVFHTNNGSARAERMRLTSAGYLGIGGDTTPDALLDLDSTDTDGGDFLITNTGIGLSGTVAGITSNSTTTGDILTISATALTSGSGLVMTGPSSTGVTDHFVKITSDVGSASSLIYGAPDFSGSAVTGYGLNITGTDATANANTDYGVYSSLALTGNAAKTGVGLYSTLSTSSTTADTLAAADLVTSTSGIITTGTRSIYGLRTQPVSTAASTGGTTNVYGVYSKAAGVVGAGGTINSYGLYVANGTMDTTGTSTNTGLYVETPSGADTNYAAVFAGGNVGIGITAPGFPLDIQSSISTATLNDKPLIMLRSTANGTTNVGPEILLGGDYHGDGTNNAGFASIQGVKENATVDNYASALRFGTRANGGAMTEQMRITSAGRIGIGMTNPTYLLDVKSAGDPTGIRIAGTSTTGNASLIAANNSASQGIISVHNASDTEVLYGVTMADYARFENYNTNAGGLILGTRGADNPILFGTNGAERMRLTSTGLGIGTTAPAGLLDISKAISGTPSTTGPYISLSASTFTDNNTAASGTAASMVFNSIAAPTLVGTNNSVTTTNAATFYIAGAPTAGTNETITNAYAFWAVGNARIGAGSLCVKSTDAACAGAVAGTIYATNQTVQAADLAENYISSQTLEPGEIVAIDTSDGGSVNEVKADSSEVNSQAVIKSTKPYQKNLMGVISTNPGVTMNSDAVTDSAHPNLYPVALAGRVPVKVSTENGPIEKGDFLTSSSTPGVAMKATRAGTVIGKALEEFVCHPERSEGSLDSSATPQNDNNCQGKIMTFVNLSFADPGNILASMILDESGNLVVPKLKVDQISLNIPSLSDGSTPISGINSTSTTGSYLDLAAKLTELTNQVKDLQNKLASLSASSDSSVPPVSSTFSATLASLESSSSATPSAQLAASDSATPSAILAFQAQTATDSAALASASNPTVTLGTDGYLDIKEIKADKATFNNELQIFGQTTTRNLAVAEMITLGGTLAFENNGIDALTGPLYLQNKGLGGIDILAGKITIDGQGNIISAGAISAKTLTATEFKGSSGKSVGSGIILAGNKSVEIPNSLVKTNSKILLTPTIETGQVLGVSAKVEGNKFVVSTPITQTQDLPFDWFLINESN